MAKTAVLNKESRDLIGIAQSEGTAKLVAEGAGLTLEQVELVTAKTFAADDRYPTFKDMCLTEAERAAAKEAADKAAADKATKDQEKEAKRKEREEAKAKKAAEQGDKPKRERAGALEGEYHVVKPFPATAADHPKMPIWSAIANHTTIEDAKAACPAENPKRKTNGVYTLASEFRYFLRTGYVAMGPAPEVSEQPAEEKQAA